MNLYWEKSNPYCLVPKKRALRAENTLVNSEGAGEDFRGFQPILLIFDQFLPILRAIFHHKVLGMRLFKQVRLFHTIRWF